MEKSAHVCSLRLSTQNMHRDVRGRYLIRTTDEGEREEFVAGAGSRPEQKDAPALLLPLASVLD